MSFHHGLIQELAKCILCCKRENNSQIFDFDPLQDPVRSKRSKRIFARDIAQQFYNLEDESIRDSAEFVEIISQIIYDMTAIERQQLLRLLIRQSDDRLAAGDPVILMPEHLYKLQSDAETEEMKVGAGDDHYETEEVVVRYLDENPGTMTPAVALNDTTFSEDYIPDNTLEKYLSRPVRIDSGITWTEGVPLNVDINPWNAFFSKPAIARKVNNYARINCNLHVKLIINASPFYYGAGLMSYQPLPTFTPSTAVLVPVNTTGRNVLLSQRPNIWFYPQTNQGGELVLPFLSHRTWLNPTNLTQLTQMGQLNLTSVIDLRNANGVAGTGVTVQVYCWATNVRICGPTLSVQADYTGPISGPASAVASVANVLEGVPMIGPYAKATSMVAGGIASLAKLFGFTNTPNISNVEAFKNLPFHAFSSSEISTPVEKLTIDPKQELTIDSRVAGHDGRDELLISSIVQRESLIRIPLWSTSTVLGTLLTRANVNPYNVLVTGGAPQYISCVPMAYISPMFGYWRGDIIYRIRVICTKFHKGRLLLQWDPNGNVGSTVGETNTVYSQIIDISETTDVEFRVPYLGQTPFLETETTNDPDTFSNINIQFSGMLNTYNQFKHNGQLNISVLTNLTAPVATSDVNILISVRGAPNLVFGGPRDIPNRLSTFALQADRSIDQYGLADASPKTDDNTFLVNMGEHITSIRQLLRRTSYVRTSMCIPNNNTDNMIYSQYHAKLPLQYGYDPTGINRAVGVVTPANNYPFNFVENTPLTWMLPCFVGYRGGINWSYNIRSDVYMDTVTAQRAFEGILSPSYYIVDTLPTTNQSVLAYNQSLRRLPGSAGQALINQKTQTGLSVYYPNYNVNRMMSTRFAGRTTGTVQDFADTDQCLLTIVAPPQKSTDSNPQVDFYCSIGTDFNLIFFLNCPIFLIYGTITPYVPP